MLNLTLVNKENQFQGLFDNPTDLRFFEYDFHGQKKFVNYYIEMKPGV